MLEEIAQNVTATIGEIIRRDIIITDIDATIIGSTDEKRLGDIHEASFRIMETGKPNPDNYRIKNLVGTREGFCLPVKLQAKTIGSVGVTGNRKEVMYYCYLLKEHLETLLYQEIYLKSIAMREQNISDLILDIAGFNPKVMDQSILWTRALEMGYNLELPYYAIIVDFAQNTDNQEERTNHGELDVTKEMKLQSLHVSLKLILSNTFNHRNTIIGLMSHNKFVVFHAIDETMYNTKNLKQILEKKCQHVLKEFSLLDISTFIGVSTESKGLEGLKSAYEEAGKSLQLRNEEHIIFYQDFMLEDALDRIPNDFIKRFTEYHLNDLKGRNDYPELFKTIKAWCETGFNRNETAEKLYIHRNTLDYRVKKIAKITNMQITDYKKFIALYIAILMD